MRALIRSCIATTFSARYGDLVSDLALAAVRTVTVEEGPGGSKDIDTKRYARVEKIPGGELEDCVVLRGVMMEKDVTHPKMRRRIANPRILLLDCPLEYKKAESATNLEVSGRTGQGKGGGGRGLFARVAVMPVPPPRAQSRGGRPMMRIYICAWTDVRE